MTELDALIVGAGFGGVWQLFRLREEGHSVRLVESGTDFGGVWHWNRYPGARVDSSVPLYEFSQPEELWKGWSWHNRFPGWRQLQAYFAYVADKLDLRRDTQFETTVTSATFDDEENRWTVKTQKEGEVFKVKFLLLNVGFAAKRYIPDFKGLDSFKGVWLHPSYWPKEGIDLSGKRVAIIGTGATGVQLTQELSKTAGHLTVFQRTPNLALPMGQKNFPSPEDQEQELPKSDYPALYAQRTRTFTGFDFDFLPRLTFDDCASERRRTYEDLWTKGDFQYWIGAYPDLLTDPAANREAYAFWRDKTRARIRDAAVREKLAPMVQPHAFGCKRISLEDGFFEVFNDTDRVSLVDLNDAPIDEVTPDGIRTADGVERPFDCIILATGYDALSGGIMQIDIRRTGSAAGACQESVKEKWERDGVSTYLGMSAAGFPNMFFTYGPHAPTAFCNGPTCAELQGNWIAGVMRYMRDRGLERIDPKPESEREWVQLVNGIASKTLLPETKSVSEASCDIFRIFADFDRSGTWATIFPARRGSHCYTLVACRRTTRG